MPSKKKSEILPRSLTVVVTKSDIKHGEVASCQKCPVALALARRFPGAVVSVGGCRVERYYRRRKYRAIFDLPWNAVEFIMSFDSTCTAKPIRFTIPLSWNQVVSSSFLRL